MPLRALHRIEGFSPVGGHAYTCLLPAGLPPGDSTERNQRSRLALTEDGVLLGPAHALHAAVAAQGGGRYSHWGETLYFSASDNSDPRNNGREYHILALPSVVDSPQTESIGLLQALPPGFDAAQAYHAVERCLAVLRPDANMGEDDKLWWRDARLLDHYRRLCGDNMRSFERKFAAYGLLASIHAVQGEIAECGAYNGSTAFFLALAGEDVGRPRPIHLFDSFQGLSAPGPEDGAFWREGALASPEEAARGNLSGVSDVHFYRGWIPERFGDVADKRFAFVHIDVDVHAPTRDSIAFFYPRLNSGGILLCDDYGFTTCPGATLAMDTYFRGRAERIIHLPTGQGFVIKP